jgi:hypothetical protein
MKCLARHPPPRSTRTFRLPPTDQPRWRDLPALARLVTRRLGKPIIRRRLVGPIAIAGATYFNLLALATARLTGRIAADETQAVVWFRHVGPRAHRRASWLGEVFLTTASMAPLLWPIWTAALADLVALRVTAGLLTAAILVLFAAGTAAMFRPEHRAAKSRSAVNSLAERPGVTLVVIIGLAGHETQRHATTVLTRRLLRYADQQCITVFASAIDSRVAHLYERNGFRTVENQPQSLYLYRPPRATRPRENTLAP